MEAGSSLFFQFASPFIPASLLLSVPWPHYLSPLSHRCCDYGCHAVVKRSTINRPEIKPKNEFPQRWPHALLSRNYLAGEWLIIPLKRQRQKHTGRNSAWLRLEGQFYSFSTHATHACWNRVQPSFPTTIKIQNHQYSHLGWIGRIPPSNHNRWDSNIPY